jgi:quinoprotein glucose dehydrogenase
MFRAYDARTGKVLWESYLGGGAFATPSTYMVDGRQFVVVPVSDDLNPEKPNQAAPFKLGDFVAFALPKP